ncbi:mitochondrial import receptor subunit TOM20 homolog [Drosophila busckii]|uniref:mitochondrial import receptor subunit TOM20 homolog n=1 Tax=Drosophila busckii TaxID=30019 RepID=UPI00083F39E4|nr:mitochondrial import receptor subunit TOM20 homolog [Drosophila busckii]
MFDNLWLTLGVATAAATGVTLLACCMYYDRKRRANPKYKQNLQPQPDDEAVNLAAVQQYFQREIKLGEELFRRRRVDEGLVHLANAVLVCSEPQQLLESMRVALPESVFRCLLSKLPQLQYAFPPNPESNEVGFD